MITEETAISFPLWNLSFTVLHLAVARTADLGLFHAREESFISP